MQPLGSSTFRDIPDTLLLFLTDTICFHFPFPESPHCRQSDMPGLSLFCVWGCVQFLLTWQYVKYHLTQENVGTLFLTDRYSVLPYFHLRFTYYLYPFASHEVIVTVVTH